MPYAAKVTEDAYVEQPALEWLAQVGWQYVPGPQLTPGGAERKRDSDVVLHATFASAIAKLNPGLPPEAIARATELALTTTHASLISDHQAFHELLLAGVPVTWIDEEHGERSTRARLVDDERTDVFLDEHAQYARWFALVSPNEPAVAQRYDHDVFATIAKALRLARADEQDGEGSGPNREARRAVEQFFSAGLAGSEILDVFAMAGDARPEISVLSDDFLDDVASRLTRPELRVALMKKLLNGEIRTRLAGNRVQHKRFSDEVAAVLARYEAKQITSAEVVKELVNLARDLRSQARRYEQLGLSREETAFYDALAAKGEDFVDDPRLKEIAVDLVAQVRQDLAVDWTERGNLEARIRARIKRLLRRHRYTAPQGGGLEEAAGRVFQQARALYERWPEVEGDPALGAVRY